MGHPDADDWREARATAGIAIKASIPDITQALHALGLDWRLFEASEAGLFGRSGKTFNSELWSGVGACRPSDRSDAPRWLGASDRSLDEAVGMALRHYFARH